VRGREGEEEGEGRRVGWMGWRESGGREEKRREREIARKRNIISCHTATWAGMGDRGRGTVYLRSCEMLPTP
jgi:hypothetical protein